MAHMVAQDEALSSWEWTPLHHAALHNHFDMVKLLLSHGADVDPSDSEVGLVCYSFGNAPLNACMYLHTCVVRHMFHLL